VNRKVAASTQNQALSALLFLYSQVLQQPFDWLVDVQRAKRPSKLPVVFAKEEARAVLRHLDGSKWLMASLLYGSGTASQPIFWRPVMTFELSRNCLGTKT
jgi:hypothetical protein